jgi:hypothetical protein
LKLPVLKGGFSGKHLGETCKTASEGYSIRMRNMKNKKCMNWMIIVLLLNAIAYAANATSVKIAAGLVEGTEENGLRVYRGIPFASPPMGNLRWQTPQPVKAWFGVKSAEKFADACLQGRPSEDGKFRDGVSIDLSPPHPVEDPDRFYRSGEK